MKGLQWWPKVPFNLTVYHSKIQHLKSKCQYSQILTFTVGVKCSEYRIQINNTRIWIHEFKYMDERFLKAYAITDVEGIAPKPIKARKSNSSPLLQCHEYLVFCFCRKQIPESDPTWQFIYFYEYLSTPLGKWELFPRWLTTSGVDQNCGQLIPTGSRPHEDWGEKKEREHEPCKFSRKKWSARNCVYLQSEHCK